MGGPRHRSETALPFGSHSVAHGGR